MCACRSLEASQGDAADEVALENEEQNDERQDDDE
jgi:hypothetical protein